LLSNKHYNGYYTYKDSKSGEIIRSECPVLLKPELIQQVTELKKKRSYGTVEGKRTHTSNEKYIYLLSGLLFCGHCGSRYGGNIKTKQTSYYSCGSKTAKYKTKDTDKFIDCTAQRNIRLEKTDEIVWNAVLNVISQSHTFKESIKLELLEKQSYRLSEADNKRKVKKLERLKKDIQHITLSIVNIETVALIGDRTRDELNQIVKNLENERLNLESQYSETLDGLVEVKKQKVWVDWVKEFGARVRNLERDVIDTETKKRFIEGVVMRITVFNSDVTSHQLKIEFCLPYVDDELIYTNTKGKLAK